MKSDPAFYLKMIPARLLIALLFLAPATVVAQPVAAQTAPAQNKPAQAAPAQVDPAAALKKLDEMVRMRDGVKLATTVYLPDGQGPWPVVLVRTPYDKSLESFRSKPVVWVRRGFAYVIQDVRGKFKSEGQYRPFVDDPQDGYDTVEWAASQQWSTGKVGMYGPSAMGITANLAAMTAPPHLVATFVMIARSSIYNQSAFMGGVFRKELNETWLKNNNALDALYETFKHNVYDGYYDSNEMSLHWGKIRVPSYNWGGWYDIFSEGNIQNFVGLQSVGGGRARGNQKLMMGPWGHGRI
ncbi:MAG TPA: CocE/NonD family hydrolase, partial [Blastocatellia bacterium]|nr:CocE/NonD family hydrolase [Blastocatellia bacterium]